MRIIQQYQAEDGQIFQTATACVEYEQVKGQTEHVMSVLNPIPKENFDFGNGNVYVLQDIGIVKGLKITIHARMIEALGEELGYGMCVRKLEGNLKYRYLHKAACRIEHIDNQGREWGQPFYANNPNPQAQEYKS